jgi:hypothetical protein
MLRGSKKRNITWKVDRAKDPPPLKPRQMPYDSGMNELDLRQLVVGALFLTQYPMAFDVEYAKQYAQPEYPYLDVTNYYTMSCSIPPSSLAVYAGPVRVEETDRRGDVIRVLRHSFIVGGTRYLINNLDFVKPA